MKFCENKPLLEKMAQRFQGAVPNQGPAGPPQPRYPPPQNPSLRQYSGPNYPVNMNLYLLLTFIIKKVLLYY